MSANVIWTSEDDKILIQFVRNNEALYNVKNRDYRKAHLKQNLWNNIGAILEKSGTDCCKRWAYVRDYYIRRRGKPGIGSGGEAAKKRSDLLSFLDGIPSSQRNSITNVVRDELHESEITEDPLADSEENIFQIDETENMIRCNCNKHNNKDDNNKGDVNEDKLMRDKKKKKLTHSEERLQLLNEIAQRKAAQNELDETDLFFNSMAKIVKKLPRYEQIQLRMQIGSLIGDAELRSISNESRQFNDSSIPSTSFPNGMLSPVKNEIFNDQEQFDYVSDTSTSISNESRQNNESSSRPSTT